MPVFDFNNTPDKDKPLTCTYTTFRSDESTATPERPMLVLDNKKRQWKHHSSGFFSNPAKQTAFELRRKMVSYPRTSCRSMPVLSVC